MNEVICHGIPDDRPLQDGDIVNLDVTLYREGVHGDTNATFLVGDVDEGSQRLVRVTHECLMLAIEGVQPGRPLSDIGRAIERACHEALYSASCARSSATASESSSTPICRSSTTTSPHSRHPMQPGMTFTIEPMITMGRWQHRMWDDGWTAVTVDGRRTAQFEHTILVTDDGADILTLAD